LKRMSVIASLFLSMFLVAPAFAYTGSADFPELFKYSDQKNANLETALLSISSSFKDSSIPITQELLSAIMATLDKEVGSDYLPIEENGDYGMGANCTYKISGSCRSTSYDGGVDYKGRGYIQITGKSNYQTYCGSDCVGTSTPELDICGCKNQWQCTVTDASICPQVKALQPDYAAKIFALYYVTNKLVSVSNSKNYWDVGKIINGGNAYASDFSIKANEYLTLFSNNPDKIQKLLTWLDSGTPASTPVADQEITVTDTKDALLQKSAVQNAILNPSTSPIETWNKTFGKGVLYSVQQTSDGNYIATGYRSERDNQDVLLIKTDEAGNELLNKTFDNHSLDWGSSIQLTSDGGYIIAGGTREELDGNYITYRAWLIKTDVDGNLLWDKTFESHNGNPGLAYSVQPTTDGGYILAGHTFGEAWLIKTDSNGNELWKRELTGSGPYYGGANCWAKSVLPTSDGGYILAGESPFTNDVILIKTDGNGEKIWDKTSDRTFGGYGLAGAFSIRSTSDGGYIIAGKTGGTWFSNSRRDIHMSPDDTFSAYGASGYAWLIKTDADGNMIWNKTYSTSYENHSGAYSVQPTNDGGYIIAGMTGLGFNEYYDAWLIKTDSEGDMVWNRTFGSGSFDEVYSVQQTRDIIAGTTAGNTWLIKTDAEGLETVPQQPKSSEAQSLSRSGQNTPTHEGAPEDTPANAKESPLPISIGAISLIAAVLSMKSRRDRLQKR
jgi:predicted chitinase